MLTLVISSTLQVHFHAPVNKYTHLAMREMLQKDNANVWETERERLSISWYRWPGSVSPCLWLNTLIPAKQNRLQLGAKHRLSREIPLNTPPAQCSAESMASCSFCSACCDADAFGCLWKAAKCLICGRRAMWELIFRSFSELCLVPDLSQEFRMSGEVWMLFSNVRPNCGLLDCGTVHIRCGN